MQLVSECWAHVGIPVLSVCPLRLNALEAASPARLRFLEPRSAAIFLGAEPLTPQQSRFFSEKIMQCWRRLCFLK
jgi:hypothetical protein